jgi:hypothetical protein
MTTHLPALAALCLAALAPFAAGADEKAAENAKARMAAAQKVYQGTLARLKVDANYPLDAEGLYRWSRRWLEAERELREKKEGRVAAAQAHLDRMKKLEALMRGWRDSKFFTDTDVAAVEFYRLEAERWLARAKGD